MALERWARPDPLSRFPSCTQHSVVWQRSTGMLPSAQHKPRFMKSQAARSYAHCQGFQACVMGHLLQLRQYHHVRGIDPAQVEFTRHGGV